MPPPHRITAFLSIFPIKHEAMLRSAMHPHCFCVDHHAASSLMRTDHRFSASSSAIIVANTS